MTKSKKIFAAMVAACSAGVVGVTAFAATFSSNNFKFSLSGKDDQYLGVSSGVTKSGWSNPAEVHITYGNLNANNKVFLSVTGDANWPEEYVMSEEVVMSSISDCEISYNADYVVPITVYLLATTGNDVTFEGYWYP